VKWDEALTPVNGVFGPTAKKHDTRKVFQQPVTSYTVGNFGRTDSASRVEPVSGTSPNQYLTL